jgi:hypothetical protein
MIKHAHICKTVAAAATFLLLGASPGAADTFDRNRLNFFAEVTNAKGEAWKADFTVRSLGTGLNAVSLAVDRGVAAAVTRSVRARTVGTVFVGGASYRLRVPAGRSGPVTVLRDGRLRVVLRSASPTGGRAAAFLSVTGLDARSTDLRIDLRPGIVRITDQRCVRFRASVARPALPVAGASSGQGTGCRRR